MRPTAMTSNPATGGTHDTAGDQPWHAIGAVGQRIFGVLLRWQDRANQRHRLSQLSPYLMRDIGLSHGVAAREASKPFWID